ncbi:MAG TPA: 30S ribosomal protein S1 [Clostridia bacterium]|nr:30S ribosomal protein S1 [Clostridia bacterium]
MNGDMQDLMEEIEKSMVRLRRGEIVTGEVINVTDDEIIVNLGYKSDGIIPKDEMSNDVTINPSDIAKEGDEIEVYVLSLDDGEGNVLLSKKRVTIVKGWDYLEKIKEEEVLVEANVLEAVKGGVIAMIRGIRCFIPASHLSDHYVDDLKVFEGQSLDTKIIEIDRRKNKVILSRRVVLEEENKLKREELFSKLEKGSHIQGEVKRITNFGAFVDIGGVDGLIHISELSWGRVKHPTEVVNVGDIVEVQVLNFDKDRGRVSLGLKQTQPHPWETAEQKYPVGSIIEGKVVRLVDFGAFIQLELGLDGLVHISQISEEHISKPSDRLHIGQKVKVKVLDIKPEDRRISLSISAVDIDIDGGDEQEQYIGDSDDDIAINGDDEQEQYIDDVNDNAVTNEEDAQEQHIDDDGDDDTVTKGGDAQEQHIDDDSDNNIITNEEDAQEQHIDDNENIATYEDVEEINDEK